MDAGWLGLLAIVRNTGAAALVLLPLGYSLFLDRNSGGARALSALRKILRLSRTLR
jgi:hypothetical protein